MSCNSNALDEYLRGYKCCYFDPGWVHLNLWYVFLSKYFTIHPCVHLLQLKAYYNIRPGTLNGFIAPRPTPATMRNHANTRGRPDIIQVIPQEALDNDMETIHDQGGHAHEKLPQKVAMISKDDVPVSQTSTLLRTLQRQRRNR